MTEQIFSVALHYGADNVGQLTYDEAQKTAVVILPEQEWIEKVQHYLQTEQTINHATGLSTYEKLEIKPLDSLENLKLSLTRLWEATDVQVDWSRPVE